MRGMLSLLAGLGHGFNDSATDTEDRARRAKLDEITFARAAREQQSYDQEQADRAELRNAGAPVGAVPDMAQTPDGAMQRLIKPDTMDNADVGMPGEAPVTAPAFKVGMQGMLNDQQAGRAVAAANDPSAVRARQIAVLQRQSPERAAALMASDTHLKATQTDLANKQFDSDINQAASKGIEALVDWTNNSPGTTMKAKVVPSADGKFAEIHQVMPDGSLKPTGLSFENNQKGALEAAQLLARQVPIATKLKHYADVQTSARKDNQVERDLAVKERLATVAEQNADTKESAASTKTAKPLVERMSEADKVTYGDINKQREQISGAITRAQAEGTWDPNSDGAKALQTRMAALGMRATALTAKYEKEGGTAPDPLGLRKPAPAASGNTREREKITPAQQAANDSDRPAILAAELANAKDETERAAIQREIDRLPAVQKAKATQRAATPPATAAAAPAARVAPVVPAAPAQPNGIMRRLIELGTDYTSEEGKSKLLARVAEAAKGGTPLTEVEKLRAQQAGLV